MQSDYDEELIQKQGMTHVGVNTSTTLRNLSQDVIWTGAIYADVTSALAAHNTVITWDMRGHGRSSYPDDHAAYSPELSIADMVALLDAVEVTRTLTVAGGAVSGS